MSEKLNLSLDIAKLESVEGRTVNASVVGLTDGAKILRACTGLTLDEALARLRGGATELYPSTWPAQNDIPSAETVQKVGSFGVQNVTPEPVVRLADVERVFSGGCGAGECRKCTERNFCRQGLRFATLYALAAPAQKEEGNG